VKLGILVNSDTHLQDILGLAEAALRKGHELILFTMDGGISLLENPAYVALSMRPGIRVSFCDHNAQQRGFSKEQVPDGITCGSQFDNAVMGHEADRVIVL